MSLPRIRWVADPVVKIIGEFEASLKRYPPIKAGTSAAFATTAGSSSSWSSARKA